MKMVRACACFWLVWLISVAARADDAAGPSFVNDIVPVLTRFGCNTGGCHGKLAGQNGFRLSLRGYAPELDYESITREARGRRIGLAAPEVSLLLRKALGEVPHGGGQRFEPNSAAHRALLAWLRAGASGPRPNEATVSRLDVTPRAERLKVGESRPLRAVATFSDGTQRDVTWLTKFDSNDAGLLAVSADGEVRAARHGETVVRAAYQGLVDVATFTIPYETQTQPEWYAARNNVVDEHVMNKLAALRIEPASLCDDATFLRRAMLDTTGTLPTLDEVRAFLADARPDKRRQLVEQLLQRPEFVDFWTLQLSDLLQNRKERDHDVRGAKGVRAFHTWLRQQVAANRPWHELARDVLTATGSATENPAVGYFVVTVGEKESHQSEVTDSVAQAFLGTRIGCARCHNHPLEKYTQDDFYHFAAFFSRVALNRQEPAAGPTTLVIGTRHTANLEKQIRDEQKKLDELRAKNADEKLLAETAGRIAAWQKEREQQLQQPVQVQQPRTNKPLPPRPLDRSPTTIPPAGDPRAALAQWMTDPQNEIFAGAMVNRLWKHFFAVGLVEPVDDLRATNPPSNGELWRALIGEFVGHQFDLKHVMRLILNSRTYQLAADTRPSNVHDTRFYSHYYARRLPAEVLLDALCQATDVPETFAGYPRGMRAIQIPDSGAESYFLTLFGRSPRITACACERESDVTLPQLLHLQNGDVLQKLTASEGRLAALLARESDNAHATDELFFIALGRPPTTDELAAVNQSLAAGGDRREIFADLFWALLNSKEFAFNH